MISKEVLKRIQLVVLDLDGTILDDNGNLHPDTVVLVKKLKELGVKFSIATGRLHNATVSYAQTLSIEEPIISLDGTLIKNYLTDKIIYQSAIPERIVVKAISLADRYFLKIALCHGDAIYYTEENSLIPNLLEKFGAKYEIVNSYNGIINKTLEIVMTSDYSNMLRLAANKLSFPFTFGVRTSFYKAQSHGGIYYLEVRKMGSNKGEALKKLCKHSHVKIKNTAVLGDWYNDKSLFETDALKITVANAVPEIKRLSDMVTKNSNNEGGVNEFLKLLLKSKS
jgi:Cof subfamily protein (haloacid dehalogenase superfamily)